MKLHQAAYAHGAGLRKTWRFKNGSTRAFFRQSLDFNKVIISRIMQEIMAKNLPGRKTGNAGRNYWPSG
jgi:hypothetical protein